MKQWWQRPLLSEGPLASHKPLSQEEVPLTKVALYVESKAKTERAEELAEFLTFGIFDAFTEEAGRQAHLAGRIAEALMSRAGPGQAR